MTGQLNKIADEVERKAKTPKAEDAKTVGEVLRRMAEAMDKLCK